MKRKQEDIDKALEHAAILTSWANGRRVERRERYSKDRWASQAHPALNFVNYEYRLAKKQ